MDYIQIKRLVIFAYHGVLPEEKRVGQKFIISAKLYFDLTEAALDDDLTKTVNYAEVCMLIEKIMTEDKYDLIETVAHKVIMGILCNYPIIKKVNIEVSKPNAPILMDFDTVLVNMTRGRHIAYLSLGSNLGDKEGYLDYAIDQLNSDAYTKVTSVSSFIVTKPYGDVLQDDFLNGCIQIETLYRPLELLKIINKIEDGAGRKRIIHWGPRTLDIDILLFDDLVVNEDNLYIPHKEMANRRFVLEPLCEIGSNVLHPVFKKSVSELLKALLDNN